MIGISYNSKLQIQTYFLSSQNGLCNYMISNPISVFTLQHVLGREHTHTPLQYSLRPLFSHTQESIRIGKPQNYLPRNQKVLGQIKILGWMQSTKCSTIKTGSGKIIYWLCRFSFLLGFNMPKKVRGCVIKPRRKEYLPSQ